MKLLPVLFILFSFSAFADNPYSNAKRWEAEDRFNHPENFNSGRDAYYNANKYDQYEREMQRNREAEREMRDFRDSVERSRY